MFDTAIFDMDGTLLDTLEDIADSTNHTLHCLGYPPVSLEKVRASVGNGAAQLLDRVLPGGREDPAFEEALKLQNSYYQAHCDIKTRPYDGLVEVLRVMKENGIRMGIVSNKKDEAVNALNRKYFGDLIPVAVGERAGIRRKPAPDSVLEAMRLLGAEASDTIYVGDSEVDYETAVQAGIPCILVSWGFRERKVLEEQFHPQYMIDRPEELKPFFLE